MLTWRVISCQEIKRSQHVGSQAPLINMKFRGREWYATFPCSAASFKV